MRNFNTLNEIDNKIPLYREFKITYFLFPTSQIPHNNKLKRIYTRCSKKDYNTL